MLRWLRGARRIGWRGTYSRRAVAALEFAVIAPMSAILLAGIYDVASALIVWGEICNAAQAIAQAAEKLSVASDQNQSMLSAGQMQNAMSVIYAQMPGLSLGSGTGSLPGRFAVTLSSVVYVPLCGTASGCAPQTPYTLWSSYFAEGGSQLITTSTPGSPLLRSCGELIAVGNFPNDSTQPTKMLDPTKVAGATTMTLTPQIVADVHYQFTPSFMFFFGVVTFWASAVVPTPIGGTEQETTFDSTGGPGNVVSCTVPS